MLSHERLVVVSSGGGVALTYFFFLRFGGVGNAVEEFGEALQEPLAVDTCEDPLSKLSRQIANRKA